MNALQLLQLVQALSAMVDLADSLGVNSQRLLDMKARAAEEGRDLSDADLLELKQSAEQALIDARNA